MREFGGSARWGGLGAWGRRRGPSAARQSASNLAVAVPRWGDDTCAPDWPPRQAQWSRCAFGVMNKPAVTLQIFSVFSFSFDPAFQIVQVVRFQLHYDGQIKGVDLVKLCWGTPTYVPPWPWPGCPLTVKGPSRDAVATHLNHPVHRRSHTRLQTALTATTPIAQHRRN
jgi:hypothetical protein